MRWYSSSTDRSAHVAVLQRCTATQNGTPTAPKKDHSAIWSHDVTAVSVAFQVRGTPVHGSFDDILTRKNGPTFGVRNDQTLSVEFHIGHVDSLRINTKVSVRPVTHLIKILQ